MNLTDAKKLATDLMQQHGLIAEGWTFEFDRAVKRFGLCSFRTKTISLSREITQLNEEHHVKNTILHEIAHALVGVGHGHDAVWRSKAQSIGCTGERLYRTSQVATPTLRYKLKCPTCGVTVKRARKPRRGLACGRCCAGIYNPKHKFILLEA